MFHGRKVNKPYEFKKTPPALHSEFYWYQEDKQGKVWIHVHPTLGVASDTQRQYQTDMNTTRLSVIKHRHNSVKEPSRTFEVKMDALIQTIFDHPNTYICSQRERDESH